MKKFTVGDLLSKMKITNVSCCYRNSKIIKGHPEREIVAYTLGPYSGLIIGKKLDKKDTYFACKFIINHYAYGNYKTGSFCGISISEALNELHRFRMEGYKVELSKETEEKIRSSEFMRNI